MIDWHTHNLRRNSVVNVDPTGLNARAIRKMMPQRKGYMYSVGIHPWNADKATIHDLLSVRALAIAPDVTAIGEVGLDTTKGDVSDITRQIAILKYHVKISEELKKPLILHIVKRFPEIIRLKRELKPTQRWIIHGFRGKPELAKELLRHGFYLSFGERFNPESAGATPSDKLLIETDESSLTINQIRRMVSKHENAF